MTWDQKTGFVTLQEVATDQLIKKFDEILLYNKATNLEIGSTSN
jgi:hypothetical protein